MNNPADLDLNKNPAKKTQRICNLNPETTTNGNDECIIPRSTLPTTVAAVTHTGFCRVNNEDCYGYHVSRNDTVRLLAVADGIGGHGNGDHASRLLIRELLNFWRKHCDTFDPAQWETITEDMKHELILINNKIHAINLSVGIKVHMGSTLALLLILPEKVITFHAGDSRIYRLRDRQLTPLTEDHSYITEFLKNGTLTKEKAPDHPLAHVILRSIGTIANAEVEVNSYDLKDGDFFMVCSDGLTEHLTDEMICEIMNRNETPNMAVKELLQHTLRNGAHDNITALCTKYS